MIYYGKTTVLWIKLWYCGNKLWLYRKKYDTKNYGTLNYYGKKYGTMENIWYYNKLYLTIVNY